MQLEKERWQRIERILDEALELPKPEVPAFLDEACGGDAGLRRDVERLLEADSQAGSFLELWAAEYAATLVRDADESPSQALPEDLPQLGPYRIVSKIGSGAMGVVFEAEDTRLHRQVALKLLPPSVGADTQAKERFLREARSISALDHPNLCTVHDIGETEDGLVYLVMTYYGRQTLAHRIAKGPLAVEEALDLAMQIARGLERAHEAGVPPRRQAGQRPGHRARRGQPPHWGSQDPARGESTKSWLVTRPDSNRSSVGPASSASGASTVRLALPDGSESQIA